MKYTLIPLIFLLILVVGPPVFAQVAEEDTEEESSTVPIFSSDNDDDGDELVLSSSVLKVWIPEIMIKGETYKGLVVSDNYKPMSVVLTTSDPNQVSTDATVFIRSDTHHIIFYIGKMISLQRFGDEFTLDPE